MQLPRRTTVLRSLAVEVEHAVRRRVEREEPGRTAGTLLARGDGWIAADVVCTFGPADRPFEERHEGVSIALVLAGSFQYRTGNTSETVIPGSLLLGNDGQCFECGHRHAAGDRCLAFHFTTQYFERAAFDAGAQGASGGFRIGRLPPLRELSWIGARAAAGILEQNSTAWDELALEVAAMASRLANGESRRSSAVPPNAESRVTASVRAIEQDPAAGHSLPRLAQEAGLSPFHYLRTFRRVTGVTPHQFILRTRLREAAARLTWGTEKVIQVAFDTGFSDLSTFNRTFRAEFGMTPRDFRRRAELAGTPL